MPINSGFRKTLPEVNEPMTFNNGPRNVGLHAAFGDLLSTFKRSGIICGKSESVPC